MRTYRQNLKFYCNFHELWKFCAPTSGTYLIYRDMKNKCEPKNGLALISCTYPRVRPKPIFAQGTAPKPNTIFVPHHGSSTSLDKDSSALNTFRDRMPRGGSWRTSEDESLARAWVSVSECPISGSDQKHTVEYIISGCHSLQSFFKSFPVLSLGNAWQAG